MAFYLLVFRHTEAKRATKEDNMKTKTLKTIVTFVVIATAWMAFSPSIARATTLDFYQAGDTHDLGSIYYGIPSGDADRTAYTNYLKSLAPGTGIGSPVPGAGGQSYTRSLNNPLGAYPQAVWALNGTGNSINLGALGTYTYLFAKYDGPNAGSEVWYVGNLSGVITIPTNGLYENGYQYGLSGWTLFTGGATSVPDGGTTLMLLGSALGGIGLVRRFLSR